jgi:nanoRNase/pAp phosphatase (c-di-AMP/oligoRNAs hydrolase)
MFDGLKCIAVNRLMANSKFFDSVWDPHTYDAMLSFGWRGSQWTVSLYTDRPDIDVSEVARKRGGGGHKGAAGFQCTDLFFVPSPMKEAINP